MIVILDNYDSFTYNVVQLVSQLTTSPIEVFRSDKLTIAELIKLNPEKLIISPGPGRPIDAGISLEAITSFAGKIPILGICLGHQTIAQTFGGEIIGAKNIVHGKTEKIQIDGHGLFRNLGKEEVFTRYHSLAVNRKNLPDCLEITAESSDGEIMGIRHKEYPIEGVQFHPESIGSLTDSGSMRNSEKRGPGEKIIHNFLHYKRDALPRKQILIKLQNGEDLLFEEAEDFMDELTEGNLSESFIAAVLVGMNIKGITSEEIAACASVLQKKKTGIAHEKAVLDTCGTGGDGQGTFNISSFSALIASAAGAIVAKHGNRAVSSKCGSSDFYSELEINYNLNPENAAKLLQSCGFTYLHAPFYHSAMRFAAPVRRELGIKTIMNLLGPLVNPAEADYRIIGVWTPELCPVMARAAKMVGVSRVMTVSSYDGLDEISPAAPSRLFFIDEEDSETDEIFDPATLGITGFTLSDLKGGNSSENAAMARQLLEGKGVEAVRETCLLNAGAALYVGKISETIEEGYRMASKALASGGVKDKLEEIVNESHQLESKN